MLGQIVVGTIRDTPEFAPANGKKNSRSVVALL